MSIDSTMQVENPDVSASLPEQATPATQTQLPAQQQTAPPAAPQPFWKTLLQGALNGIAGGAGAHNWGQALAGGVQGQVAADQRALQNKLQQQQADQQSQQSAAEIRFRDVQSGLYAAQASAEAQRVKDYPQEHADAHDASVLNQAKAIYELTGIPFKQVIGADGVNQFAAQAMSTDPSGVSLAAKPLVGSRFTLVPDTSGTNPINQQYTFAANFADAIGGPAPQRATVAANPSGATKPAMDYLMGMQPGGSAVPNDDVLGAIKTTKDQMDAYTKRTPNPKPDVLGIFKQRITALQNQYDGHVANKKRADDEEVNKAGRKMEMASHYNTISVDDGNGGTLIMPKAQVIRGGAGGAVQPGEPVHAAMHGVMVMGTMPDGSQVAGTPQQMAQWGAQGATKLPGQQQQMVTVARQMVAPNGLLPGAFHAISKLEKDGKLDVVASRWNEFMTGTLGDDPQFAPYRTDMKLLQTALMQAHVGARGGDTMLQHFANIMDSGKMDAATMKAALGKVNDYMVEKAAFPAQGMNYRAGGNQQPKDGDTKTNSHGDPIVYHNGAWGLSAGGTK